MGSILFVLVVASSLLLQTEIALGADGTARAGEHNEHLTLEAIPGTDRMKVILTRRAEERLGIEIGKIELAKVRLTKMVGGRVAHPTAIIAEQKKSTRGVLNLGLIGGNAPRGANLIRPAENEIWIRVTLTEDEWARIAKNQSVSVFRLSANAEDRPAAVPATLVDLEPLVDPKRTMLTVFYKIVDPPSNFEMHNRVRLELQQIGPAGKQLVTPYSSLYYNGVGEAWVYVRTQPRTYKRHPVSVEQIVGDIAVLSSGPAVGTDVVTTGAALLYGAEVVFKR